MIGRADGYTAQVADACVIVPTVNPAHVTPHAEAFQAVVWHLLVTHPALKAAETRWESLAMNRAVFLDRDGVLTRALVRDGKAYAPVTPDEMEIDPEAPAALARLKAAGFLLIMVTNQPDVARGITRREDVETMHADSARRTAARRIAASAITTTAMAATAASPSPACCSPLHARTTSISGKASWWATAGGTSTRAPPRVAVPCGSTMGIGSGRRSMHPMRGWRLWRGRRIGFWLQARVHLSRHAESI